MKKVAVCTLAAGAISLGAIGQANAGPLAPLVHQANNLRQNAWNTLAHAQNLERQIHHLKRRGCNTRHLEHRVRNLHRKARQLALQSNRYAQKAFNRGYHRPAHSHVRKVMYRYKTHYS